jgi:hypothetical protein
MSQQMCKQTCNVFCALHILQVVLLFNLTQHHCDYPNIIFENTVLHNTYVSFKVTSFCPSNRASPDLFFTSYSEQFFVMLRSDVGLLDGPKVVTLQIVYALCNSLFSYTMYYIVWYCGGVWIGVPEEKSSFSSCPEYPTLYLFSTRISFCRGKMSSA